MKTFEQKNLLRQKEQKKSVGILRQNEKDEGDGEWS